VGAIDHEGLVRPESGIDFGSDPKRGACLMVGEAVGRVVSCANGIDIEFLKKSLSAKVIVQEAFVGLIPDFLSSVRVQEGADSKAAPKFEMSPVEERVAHREGDRPGPGFEFFTGRGIAGNV
tara:strand:- start:30 stop:395 length:366 start_codon:yes stop_codon:yes gene_type:complete